MRNALRLDNVCSPVSCWCFRLPDHSISKVCSAAEADVCLASNLQLDALRIDDMCNATETNVCTARSFE